MAVMLNLKIWFVTNIIQTCDKLEVSDELIAARISAGNDEMVIAISLYSL